MRDVYGVGDEVEEIEHFTRTGQITLDPTASFWPEWLGIVKDTLTRGVVMRRARIVSEPVTDYIRWEHAVTPLNLGAGEQVRWLPRRHASDIPLPGNDFWLIDDRLAVLPVQRAARVPADARLRHGPHGADHRLPGHPERRHRGRGRPGRPLPGAHPAVRGR